MSYASLALVLMTLTITTAAFGGANPYVTLPLHAKLSSFEPCFAYLPVDCQGVRPTVNIPSAAPIAIFLFFYNYTGVAGVQTAFDWPGWSLTFGLWDCQGGQLSAVTPVNPGGATAGTITTAFNCVNGGALAVVGRLHLVPAGAPGCVSQVQSTFPGGISVLDCAQGTDQIPDSQADRLGKICVGQGGVDACLVPHTAVESSTWGSIKAQYN